MLRLKHLIMSEIKIENTFSLSDEVRIILFTDNWTRKNNAKINE